jgi:hypothetical protein
MKPNGNGDAYPPRGCPRYLETFTRKKKRHSRMLHNGSVLVFQTRGAGSIPAIRSERIHDMSTKEVLDKEWQTFRTTLHQWAVGDINDCEFYMYLTTTEWNDPASQRLANVFLKQETEGYWRASYYHSRMH